MQPPSQQSDTIGHTLREKRVQAGYTLRQLAAKMHYHCTYLSKVEAGQRTVTPSVVRAYADALQWKADETEYLLLQAGEVPADIVELLARKPALLEQMRR